MYLDLRARTMPKQWGWRMLSSEKLINLYPSKILLRSSNEVG
jgi:hypothetical protein